MPSKTEQARKMLGQTSQPQQSPSTTPSSKVEQARALLERGDVPFVTKQATRDTAGAPPSKLPAFDQFLQTGSKIADTIFGGGKVGEAIGTQAAKMGLTGLSQEERQYVDKGPTAGEIAGSAARSALLFTPVGRASSALGGGLARLGVPAAQTLGKVGAGAGLGYGYDVATSVEDRESLADTLTPGVGTIVGGALPGVPAALGAARRMVPRKTPSPTEVAGRIVQGKTPAERRVAERGISLVDTRGVKTYSELSNRLQKAIDTRKTTKSAELAQKTQPVKLSQLVQRSDVDGRKVSINYVEEALSGLKDLYNRTRDVSGEARIFNLLQKARKQGLTPSEIDDIAVEYGKAFRAKGFDKIGQPLTATNQQAFENIRKGVKETSRSFLDSDVAKLADKETSTLINTQKLVDRMENQVSKLEQRVKERGLVEKIFRGLGTAADVVTLGGPRAFITKLLFPSNVGLKTQNALDIQRQLQNNLKLLQQMNKASDTELQRILNTLIQRFLKNPQGATPGDFLLNQIQGAGKPANLSQARQGLARKMILAPQAKKYIDRNIKDIVNAVPDTIPVLAPLKKSDTALSKIMREYGGDVEKLKDLARNTIIFKTPQARKRVLELMSQRDDLASPPKIQTPDKYMGYEGIIYNIKTPGGLIAETQIVSPKMTYGKNLPEFSRSVLGEDLFNQIKNETGVEPGLGHKIYEEYRKLSPKEQLSAKGKKLLNESFDYYNKLR